jgi:predicted nucleic acid-binding protein
MYGQVVVTPTILAEFGRKLPDWITIISPSNDTIIKLLEETIDPGEASSIALALEMDNALVILDDLLARKVALQLGLTITGTLGIIANAKRRGIIPSAKLLFELIKATDFRIPNSLLSSILKELGEE